MVPGSSRPTRTAAVWVAVAVGLVVLVLLIVFFVQNQDMVTVRFFGLEGSLALGTTLFIAAVGGGVLVALAGGARILQLRIINHRRQRSLAGPGTGA
ncbi:lipopolysaccharide assembly LapA domain-containing protein [Paenarthrobacter ureafaciens]|uniref:LapA family protein n=1 Tax=Paenarthrobacter TaxID=1742992 RepID=UPI00222E3426|nr:LapA family protein [Paenarthrobacter sp. PAE-2]MCW3767092.1 LapA family protein [Paenarthrobacter sp. PAE-2]